MAPSDLKTLFSETVALSPGNPCCLHLRLNNKGLADKEAVSLGKYIDGFLTSRMLADDVEIFCNMDLADNDIGSSGLVAVLTALEKHCVICKCVKLYRNRLGDEGGLRLARTVCSQAGACEELHLSHNSFTWKSLVALCMAVARNDCYPFLSRRDKGNNDDRHLYIPCWLRIEQNAIARPLDVVEIIAREGEVDICIPENRDDCNPWKCAYSTEDPYEVPKVHLLSITNQARVSRSTFDEIEVRDEVRRWMGLGHRPISIAAPLPVKGAYAPPTPTTSGQAELQSCCAARSRSSSDLGCTGTSPGAYPSSGAEADKASQRPVAATPSSTGGTGMAPVTPSGYPAANGANGHAGGDVMKAIASGDHWPEPTNLGERSSSNGSGSGSPQNPAAAAAPPPQPVSQRVSLLVDRNGKRRIHPDQLEDNNESSAQRFVCHLCKFVMLKPVMTNCCHLFCGTCFSAYVEKQVMQRKMKQAINGGGSSPIPHVPCPQPGCERQLQKKDVTALEAIVQQNTTVSSKSSAATLLMRLQRKLKVRCVHHCDFFDCSYGKDAESIQRSRGLKCSWAGGLADYDAHVASHCAVEIAVAAREKDEANSSKTPKSRDPETPQKTFQSGREADAQRVQVMARTEEQMRREAEERRQAEEQRRLAEERKHAEERKAEERNRRAGEEQRRLEGERQERRMQEGRRIQEEERRLQDERRRFEEWKAAEERRLNHERRAFEERLRPKAAVLPGDGEVRACRFDFTAPEGDRSKISLKADDFVRVFQITETGWAAGVRLDRRTQREIGESGWFPVSYLKPAGPGRAPEAP
eukprot:TRINITY_DN16809_c0_g1_i1.p1 TRINITY_DN16809_c0_g1~~TRINITY_DN16809_c0_g1_i1.p1  ORF type:complete len:810 (+),score=182.43 TRINITY_DN16809_c0_g1_i1:130-2559(+)